MKKATTLIAMALGLALTLPISADQQDSKPAETDKTAGLSLEQIATPSDFSDDICWVAPEWREL